MLSRRVAACPGVVEWTKPEAGPGNRRNERSRSAPMHQKVRVVFFIVFRLLEVQGIRVGRFDSAQRPGVSTPLNERSRNDLSNLVKRRSALLHLDAATNRFGRSRIRRLVVFHVLECHFDVVDGHGSSVVCVVIQCARVAQYPVFV